MALRDAVEYTKDGRGVRLLNTGARGGTLLCRVVVLTSPAGSERQLELRAPKETIELRSYCVLELTDGTERLLIGPKRTEAKPVHRFSNEKGVFWFEGEVQPFHLSRLWLKNDATQMRFFLGNERLRSKMKWKIDGGGSRYHFEMDEYCNAYYEGI